MRRIRRSLHACTWVALCAVWLLALAPAATHALAEPSGGWAEVCTARGLARVPADGSPAPRDGTTWPASAPGLAHCPLCSVGSDAPALPSAPAAVARTVATHAPPVAAFVPERSVDGWPDGWPRAPPTGAA